MKSRKVMAPWRRIQETIASFKASFSVRVASSVIGYEAHHSVDGASLSFDLC